jgi:hypothetical protein
MKLLTLILIFCAPITAQAISLKIFVVPSAYKLQWSSTPNLLNSFLRSQALSQHGNGFSDAQRKAIGHVVAKIECPLETRWTSISINPLNMAPLLLKKGIRGMFAENSKAYIQSEAEIKQFVVNNHKNAIVMKFPLGTNTCAEMLKMDDVHRAEPKLWFGPLIDTMSHYQSGRKMGGSGSTYVVALKKLDALTPVDFNLWVENIELSGSRERFSFYSVQSMWEFATREHARKKNLKFVERVSHRNKVVRLKGVEF